MGSCDALVGLTLLLVRAGNEDDTFASAARQQGGKVFHHPVMQIVETSETLASSSLQDADALIFVSRNAVHITVNLLAARQQSLPENMACYAVGSSTAAALASAGIMAVTPCGEMTSEGLLALPQLQSVAGQRILIIAGEGGRDLLETELLKRGADVEKLPIYRREVSSAQAGSICQLLRDGEPGAVVVHSRELLEALVSIIPDSDVAKYLCDKPLLVPSERVARSARKLGFTSVICARSALPEDMVSALVRWYS